LCRQVAKPAGCQADGADGSTSAAPAHLSAALPALLAALLDPSAVAEPSALGGALLHTAQCALLSANPNPNPHLLTLTP